MTRNLSLIPTIEAEPEAAPPATPPRAAPMCVESVAVLPPRAEVAALGCQRATARAQADRSRALTIVLEVLAYAVIVLLFIDVAWPLYVWIGK